MKFVLLEWVDSAGVITNQNLSGIDVWDDSGLSRSLGQSEFRSQLRKGTWWTSGRLLTS